ncbi:MAG: integration host factor subunit alpha [Desulfobacteraceae bacterium]|jgi:integration host factor subunit alpha|nr:MAG: integration host factor subunit alpha [Desulfobacteraceae bacterium]
MALTKASIIESIHGKLGLPKKNCADLVDDLLDVIKSRLAVGEDVLVSGFGKFCVRDKNKRRGRNPATGEDMMLNGRRVVTFRCSSVLRDRING